MSMEKLLQKGRAKTQKKSKPVKGTASKKKKSSGGKTKMVTIPIDERDYSVKPGHWENNMWIWGDGKKTHARYIQAGIMKKMKLPPGFYAASKKNPAATHMATVAKQFGLKELPTMRKAK